MANDDSNHDADRDEILQRRARLVRRTLKRVGVPLAAASTLGLSACEKPIPCLSPPPEQMPADATAPSGHGEGDAQDPASDTADAPTHHDGEAVGETTSTGETREDADGPGLERPRPDDLPPDEKPQVCLSIAPSTDLKRRIETKKLERDADASTDSGDSEDDDGTEPGPDDTDDDNAGVPSGDPGPDSDDDDAQDDESENEETDPEATDTETTDPDDDEPHEPRICLSMIPLEGELETPE